MSWLSIVFSIMVFLTGLLSLLHGARCFWWFGQSPQSQPKLIPKSRDPSDPEVQIIYKISTILVGAVLLALSVVCFYVFFLNLK